MTWNEHGIFEGKHAFLSASQGSWVNYTPDKLVDSYSSFKAKIEGTELHAIANILVKKRIKVANYKKAFNMFVNDVIGFNMQSEQTLYYSENAFGTADAISFRDNELKIFDLKTGRIPVKSFRQLDIYAAYFCLEYGQDPFTISIEQRIYQGRGYLHQEADPQVIKTIMNTTIEFDKILTQLQE